MQSAVAVGSGQPSTTNAYTANALNQYACITNSAFSASPRETIPAYDLDGNMRFNGAWTYTWDAENRLVSASNGAVRVCNTYDHQSRRIRKESFVYDAGTAQYVLQSVRTFVYDGWNPVCESSGDANQQQCTSFYTWGLDLSGTPQGAGGVGGLLAVTSYKDDDGNQTGATFFPTYDANGNVTAYLDTTGETAASFVYDAFGNAISDPVAEGLHLPFRFSTKYLDAETGLYYYGYRFYHPELGRWVSRDPIEESWGEGLYGYCVEDALNKIDVLGNFVAYPNKRKESRRDFEEKCKKHFQRLESELFDDLTRLCPCKGSSMEWVSGGEKRCCTYDSCVKGAKAFSSAYVGAVEEVFMADLRKNGVVLGDFVGNLFTFWFFEGFPALGHVDALVGRNAEEGVYGYGLQCGGWEDLFQKTFDKTLKDNKCYSSDQGFSHNGGHTWGLLMLPFGEHKLDPWPSGGSRF